eukprot:scaffold306662_cov13-Tisochrysis_lutea.AAC.1
MPAWRPHQMGQIGGFINEVNTPMHNMNTLAKASCTIFQSNAVLKLSALLAETQKYTFLTL